MRCSPSCGTLSGWINPPTQSCTFSLFPAKCCRSLGEPDVFVPQSFVTKQMEAHSSNATPPALSLKETMCGLAVSRGAICSGESPQGGSVHHSVIPSPKTDGESLKRANDESNSLYICDGCASGRPSGRVIEFTDDAFIVVSLFHCSIGDPNVNNSRNTNRLFLCHGFSRQRFLMRLKICLHQ